MPSQRTTADLWWKISAPLVLSVIVHPKGRWQGFEVEVKGKLAALVAGGVFPEAHYIVGVVAGGLLHR
jgi:hypothetical protein